jgi:phosphomannomutase
MSATSILDTPAAREADIWPPDSAEPRWDRLRRRVHIENVVTYLTVALCVLFVFKELQPSQLFSNTTPTGGDMGAHVWLPAFIKRVFIPHMRLTGWAPDWYSGFPALTYYFPLPMYLIALASYIIPYNIAFKLVTVLGLLALPVAAWAMGRLARARFPIPAALAVGSVPFLFSREFTIYGGNIGSTMAGEFGFSISLALALLFLGLVARGLQDGTHRAKASIVLACTGLCHILPLFFALGGFVVLLAMSLIATRDLNRLKWGIPVACTGGALIAFWALPFYWNLPYATNMGYGKIYAYWSSLSNHGQDDWLIAFAIVGVLLSLWRRNVIGVFLAVMAGLSALFFVITPAARLWNARVLPFWFLCLYLLAAVAVVEVGTLITELIRTDRDWIRGGYITTAVVTLLGAMIWVNYPLRQLPFGHTTKTGEYDWLGITSADHSFIPDWVYWNYSGYQNVNKTRQKEYFALVDEMKKIGADPQYGCGQAMWEYEPELNDMGTPDALMLLPYWTNGCIGSEEGLYYESSATTPYHFLNAAELSDNPSNPVRGLNYPSGPDVQEGIQHLQMLGTKYFMADTPDVQTAANRDSSLLLVATVGPFPVTYTEGTSRVKNVTWNIYEVLGSDLVQPLVNQPVVLKGVQSRNPQVWLNASQAWYLNPNEWGVLETASGPKSWARVAAYQTNLPQTALPAIQVSNVKQSPESISFDVDQTGVPVVVKQSYFPNWHVTGAKGPYRVTPNLMVVVPTADHVTLSYGKTAVDWVGDILTILGLGALIAMWRLGRVRYRKSKGDPEDALLFWGGTGNRDKVPVRMAPPDAAVLDAIFKAYDIRGTVPDQLNPELARQVGAAFARYCGSGRVVVGRDMRPSGAELAEAFSEGVISLGVDVVDLGMTSTDEMYFASGSMDAPGAMFTASHNPAQYNGIKLCRAGARPIGAETGLTEIKAAVASGAIPALDPDLFGSMTYTGVLDQYAEKVRSFVDLGSLRPLRVIADTANGMGGLVVPAVFSALPFDLQVMFGELDGTFPNHPADPIQPENLQDLRRRILDTGADVGLAFDGDADRCFLVDDRGEPLSGSTTTALVASAMLDKRPGATILYNLICSKAVPEIIRERGGIPVRTRVGHSYIKAVMADTDALFGGEHSGHYYFRDNYRADSGTIAALVVLEVLSKSGRPLSEIRKDFERYASSGEINTEVPDPAAVIDAVADHYSGPEFQGVTQDRLDGLTVDFGDWWFNLRPSNTEPLLRLNLEARDDESCRERTAEVLAVVEPRRPVDDPVGSTERAGSDEHGA